MDLLNAIYSEMRTDERGLLGGQVSKSVKSQNTRDSTVISKLSEYNFTLVTHRFFAGATLAFIVSPAVSLDRTTISQNQDIFI